MKYKWCCKQKNGSETPQVFLNHKLKDKIPLNMARAHAEPFKTVAHKKTREALQAFPR